MLKVYSTEEKKKQKRKNQIKHILQVPCICVKNVGAKDSILEYTKKDAFKEYQ